MIIIKVIITKTKVINYEEVVVVLLMMMMMTPTPFFLDYPCPASYTYAVLYLYSRSTPLC